MKTPTKTERSEQDEERKDDEPEPLLSMWSAKHLTWRELEAIPKVRLKVATKDPDEAHGKRICARGSIVQIWAEKTDYGKLYTGTLRTKNWDSIRYVAAGSTGELVEDSRAKFCGVFTGTYSLSNQGGGTTSAPMLVGMFDLPENRPAAVAER